MEKKQKKRWAVLALVLLFLLLPAAGSRTEAAARNGWVKSGGYWYYYQNGARQTGWISWQGDWYYLNANGVMYAGRWARDKGKLYYLDGSGRMLSNQWIKYRGYWYYVEGSGAAKAGGTKTINGKRYYFYPNAVMASSRFVKIGSQYYYYNADGAMVKNAWVKLRGSWYYLNPNGAMRKSEWLSWNNQWYYLTANGTMAVGWKTIDRSVYCFNKNGVMLASQWAKKGSAYFYLRANGSMDGSTSLNTGSYSTATRILYSSAGLKIVLEKQNQYGSTYWLAHIKTSSGTQLRSALSNGTYGGARQTTSSAVTGNGGIIGVNGSGFTYGDGKPFIGATIKNGYIYGNYETSYTVMAVKKDGTIYTPARGISCKDLISAGVKDTYNFGPVLINNGNDEMTNPRIIQDRSANYKYNRTAVGMVRRGEYYLLVTDGQSAGLNYNEMIRILKSRGCTYAYNLDGGGSATLVFKGRVMNRPRDGAERPCADFLYFTNS